jgi:hypothetical protein
MPPGYWDEPETNLFLDKILQHVKGPVIYIDMGASIGEFAIARAFHPNVGSVLAFEPAKTARQALKQSVGLNELRRVRVFGEATGANPGKVDVVENDTAPNRRISLVPPCCATTIVAMLDSKEKLIDLSH